MIKNITAKQKQHFLKHKRLLKDCSCSFENCEHDENLIKWVNNHLKNEIWEKIWNLKIKLDNKSYEFK